MARIRPTPPKDPLLLARATLLEGVGEEVASSFPGITRLGGQIVAALYLASEPQTMDQLSGTTGRSKSNVCVNLKGLEAFGIVDRHKGTGTRLETYTLRGKYPDVIIGAYLSRLRAVVADKQTLTDRAKGMLLGVEGAEAEELRMKLDTLARAYGKFASVFSMFPWQEGPIDLEEVLARVPARVLLELAEAVRASVAPKSS